MPKTIPFTIASARANANVTVSPRAAANRGMLTGDTAGRIFHAAAASTYPPNPPSSASVQLSVRSCRTMRACPAPIAIRTAISRCRASPRASSRLATLAHPISMNSTAAAISSAKGLAAAPTVRSRSRFTFSTRSRFNAGKSCANVRLMAAISCCASAKDAPGRSPAAAPIPACGLAGILSGAAQNST